MKNIILFAAVCLSCVLICSCKSKPKIVMTDKYLETDFSLINGIEIDELRVDSFGKDKLPYVFYLKETFCMLRDEAADKRGHIGKVIFFDKPNEGYVWRNDSTWGNFNISVRYYRYKGNISAKERMDFSYQQTYSVFPRKFKPKTWYLIDFQPGEISKKHHQFLYVDQDAGFTFYPLKINKG